MDRSDKIMLRRFVRERYPHSEDTILVEIPAYADPEILDTIRSAVIQADVPDRVHFAVCFQDDNMDFFAALSAMKHVSVKYVPLNEARGTCYARYLCQSLYDGEDFVFSIDGHMRFIKHWDTELIRQWYLCNDEKAIISFYPYGVREWYLKLRLDDPIFDNPYPGSRVKMVGWIDFDRKRGHFEQCTYDASERINAAVRDRSAFITGGYAFGAGSRSREVRYDTNMWFFGDELAQAIRLYTYGYNIYTSEYCYALHHYERAGIRKMPAENGRRAVEVSRINALMGVTDGVDLGEYGPGPVRTVDDFQAEFGIDFKTGEVSDRVKTASYGFAPAIHPKPPTVMDDPVPPMPSACGYSLCEADGAAYIGMTSDKCILPWMAKTEHAWSYVNMRRFQALSERFYGMKPGTPGLFCDIGANIGTTCIHFKKNLDPVVDILAFEPVPKLFNALRANAALSGFGDDCFTAVNAGVSDMNGMAGMSVSQSNPGASQVREGGTPVKVMRFDDYVSMARVDTGTIKYIWVDVEGFEGAFLSGAFNTLAHTMIPIVLEFTPLYLARFGHAKLFLDIVDELYESFVYMNDENTVRPVSELRDYFNDDYTMKTYVQRDVFLIRKGLSK